MFDTPNPQGLHDGGNGRPLASGTLPEIRPMLPRNLALCPQLWHGKGEETKVVAGTRVFTHVIFDCDGVLVDSEGLSADVLMNMMAEIGLPISDDNFRTDFLGRSFASAAARVLQRFGRPVPEGFQERYRERLLARMRECLNPMEGVHRVLSALRLPSWLATSSSPQRLAVSLEVTGLAPFFEGRCSTASEVSHGKPAPDLFLLAARRMSADPAHCLVLEDSEMGVLAARAAGMTVWHFRGGVHVKGGYDLPHGLVADRQVRDMAELGRIFAQSGLSADIPEEVHDVGEPSRGT
jgi:HAD superfamily hydrolase (TIGR01509 family)